MPAALLMIYTSGPERSGNTSPAGAARHSAHASALAARHTMRALMAQSYRRRLDMAPIQSC